MKPCYFAGCEIRPQVEKRQLQKASFALLADESLCQEIVNVFTCGTIIAPRRLYVLLIVVITSSSLNYRLAAGVSQLMNAITDNYK